MASAAQWTNMGLGIAKAGTDLGLGIAGGILGREDEDMASAAQWTNTGLNIAQAGTNLGLGIANGVVGGILGREEDLAGAIMELNDNEEENMICRMDIYHKCYGLQTFMSKAKALRSAELKKLVFKKILEA